MIDIISVTTVVSVSLILSLLTYHNNPKSATNRIFTFLGFSIAFWAIVIYATLQPLQQDILLFFIRLSMLAAIVMSTCVLFLCHTIPSNKIVMKKKFSIPILTLAIIGSITAMSPYMFTGLEISNGNVEPTPGPGMIMFLITGLGYSVSGIGILLRKYLHSNKTLKLKIRYLLIGLILMHVLLIWANFIVVIVFKSSAFMSFGPLFALLFLISAAYAILRHRLLEIRLLVARTITFTLVTLLLAATYATILLNIPRLFDQEYHTLISIAAALILAYTFAPLKDLLSQATDSVFHKSGYRTEDLLEQISSTTRSTINLDNLMKKVLDTLAQTMHISQAAFVILDDDKPYVQKRTGYDQPLKISQKHLSALIKAAKNTPLIFEELEEGSVKEIMRDHHLAIAMPLTVKTAKHGLLVLGEKSSGDIYTSQDLQVLEIITPQLAVAVQNSLAYDQIQKFNLTLKEEVQSATKDLKKANKELRHLDKLKDEFVYIATHELKNPVTAIKGYLSLINEGSFGSVPPKFKDPIKQLDSATVQLVNLVNDLLQIARSEAKTLKIHTQEVNLCEIIDATLAGLKPVADGKDLKLQHSCPAKDLLVKADPERLKEIINNLVSNAIKYSDQGTISVTHAIQDDQIVTHVKDQGVGIAPKNQKKLFTRFYRVEEEVAKGTPGTGLGLFIVRQLVEKMHGRIWFTSKKDHGSTFSFSLPVSKK